MAVEVINIPKNYERILPFLYPTYSVIETMDRLDNFIVHKNVNSRIEREYLDEEYRNVVIISNQIFDLVWDECVIREKCVNFVRERFGSRKRVFKPLNENGDPFIDECIRFLFFGESEVVEESNFSIFDSYGSAVFYKEYLNACNDRGDRVASSMMETFISKVCGDSTDSVYYNRARMRLGKGMKGAILGAISDNDTIDPFFKNNFQDLTQLRFFTKLLPNNYK